MVRPPIALAALFLALGGALLSGVIPSPAWAGGLAAGAGLGLLLGELMDLVERVKAERQQAKAEHRVYEVKGSLCKTCRRPLLPGMTECPFCHPMVPAESDLERTVHQDFESHDEAVAMPGIAAATRMMLEAGALGFLHVYEGKCKGQSILLSTGRLRLGRSPKNNVILNDPGVSQEHAEITPEGKGFRLRDAGSRNGTFVNDVRVDTHLLKTGDVLAIGDSRIIVQLR